MIDISSGHHLLIQIKPSNGDDWIDHNGNQITQLGFTTGNPNPLIVSGYCMNAVYDCDLKIGAMDSAFENFPINPLERLADFTFSINGIWSDAAGNISTTNFLWMLEDVNKSAGKILNLIGREVRVIVATTKIPGLIYNPTTQEWEQVGIGALTVPAISVPQLPIPTYAEAEALQACFRIEYIKFGASGRIEFDCTSLYGDITIGTPVAFAGADQKQIKPIIYGSFQDKFAPVAVEKTLDKVSRLHIEESTVARFDALMVYDKTNDVEWEVSSNLNRDGTKIDFSANFDTTINAAARTPTGAWLVNASENEVLPTDDLPDQKLFVVDDEVVGFHTPKVNSFLINGQSISPMVSRGWGESVPASHAVNAPYKLVDAAIQENSLIIDVELLPIRIYDATVVNKQGDWDAGSYTAVWEDGVGSAMQEWNCATNRELGGNPWEVIKNSKNGTASAIGQPIYVSTPVADPRQIRIVIGVIDLAGYTRPITETNLMMDFPDLSDFGGKVIESNIYLDAEAQNGAQCRFDAYAPYNGQVAAWGTTYDKETTLTLHTNSSTELTHYVFGHLSTNANQIETRTYADTPLQGGDGINQIRLQCLLVPTSTGGKPYVRINGVKIRAKIKIPITSDLKICSKVLGRLASSGNATTSATIADMLNRYLGANCLQDFADGHSVSVALIEQVKLRDVLRELAIAGVSAITQIPTGFRLTQWSSGVSHSISDDDMPIGENNQPMVHYSAPAVLSVYSSFEMRYGWDHMRGKFTRSLRVDSVDYVWDGIKNDPSLWLTTDRGATMRGFCQNASGWLGMNSSPFVIESKVIQDSWTAEDCFLRVVEWLSRPRMSFNLDCDWSRTQSIQQLDSVSVNVTGVPQRITTKQWVVVGVNVDLESMQKSLTLVEKP